MSNAPIQVSTTSPLPGAQLVNEINAALQALGTNFSGATDPAANAGPYMIWADTSTGRKRMRNGAGTAWIDLGPLQAEAVDPIDDALMASQAWVLKKLGALVPWLTFYDSVPADNVSASKDIYVNGIGVCYWDATDGVYYLRQTFSNLVTFTASGSITIPAYIKKVRLSGSAGGGGGGSFGGGGGGESIIDYEVNVAPGSAYTVTIGGGGAGGNPTGTEGGTTSFGSLLALAGGGRGSGGGGGAGGAAAAVASAIPGQGGTDASSTGVAGEGGSSMFGVGAGTNNGSPTVNAAIGYGAGGNGGRGSPGYSGTPGILHVRY